MPQPSSQSSLSLSTMGSNGKASTFPQFYCFSHCLVCVLMSPGPLVVRAQYKNSIGEAFWPSWASTLNPNLKEMSRLHYKEQTRVLQWKSLTYLSKRREEPNLKPLCFAEKQNNSISSVVTSRGMHSLERAEASFTLMKLLGCKETCILISLFAGTVLFVCLFFPPSTGFFRFLFSSLEH